MFGLNNVFFDKNTDKKEAFTLVEIMVAVFILAIIAGMTLPTFLDKTNDKSFQTQIAKLQQDVMNQIESLPANEGVPYFLETSLVKTTNDNDYNDSAEPFLRKYFNVSKYCSTPASCFASEYKNEDGSEYTLTLDGACARLKNGSSMCIVPKYYVKNNSGVVTKDTDIKVIVDLNGVRKPNVLDEDLFIFDVTTDGKARTVFQNNERHSEQLDFSAPAGNVDCSSTTFRLVCCERSSYLSSHKNQCCRVTPYSSDASCN